ncbi:MAG: hypothetical protein JWQ94_4953, partial [Tardiphaga sp.]|nr:hypothetical protein [Tardiphaga sp.]
MPTGYTAAIKDGISFEQFVWQCARAMGALVMMRDEPSDAPIPERFEPSTRNQQKAAEARAELARLKGLTHERAFDESAAAFRAAVASHDEAIAGMAALRGNYESMITRVEQWTPPSEYHIGFKEFMLQQLRDSVKWDCDTGYYEAHPPLCKTTDGFLAAA